MSKTRIVIIVAIWIIFGIGQPMKRLRQGKPEIAKIQIAQLEGALGLFHFDVGRYPTSAEGLQSLIVDPGEEGWSGPYLTDMKEIPSDPWGHPFQYRSPEGQGAYDLWSFGAKRPGELTNKQTDSRKERQ